LFSITYLSLLVFRLHRCRRNRRQSNPPSAIEEFKLICFIEAKVVPLSTFPFMQRNNYEQESARAELGPDWYEELALSIIREAAKLRRSLDIYDVPLLAKMIEDAVHGRESINRRRAEQNTQDKPAAPNARI